MAFIDVAGFVSDMKSHAIDHGFHVHDERHFVETYSLRQLWEVDLHPEEACDGPIDLHLSLEVDPRALLGFEDEMSKLEDPSDEPPQGFDPARVFDGNSSQSFAVIDVRKGKGTSLRALATSTQSLGEWDQLKLPIYNLNTLASLVLWHGIDVYVQEPLELRDLIVAQLETLVSNHG
mgnify:CR=1 FL=1